MTQEDLATDDVMILDTWDQVTNILSFTKPKQTDLHKINELLNDFLEIQYESISMSPVVSDCSGCVAGVCMDR